jgi:release factor glutamine methyltransferase
MPDTVEALLGRARRELEKADIATATLDARLLLQAASGLSHADIIANPGLPVPNPARLEEMIARRRNREPVSRIMGEREFYGRVFKVTPDVLDPRADSETLIDSVLKRVSRTAAPRLLDLGTGSGILAITLLAELPGATALAVDMSAEALRTAADNAVRLGVAHRMAVQCTDWFTGLEGTFDVIVSNPPYIATGDIESLAPEVRDFDPRPALDGGSDGLSAYRGIAAHAPGFLRKGGLMAVEIGWSHAKPVAHIFLSNKFNVLDVDKDIAGHDRVLIFTAS